MTLAVPDDARDMTSGRGDQAKRERRRWEAQVVFGRGQNTARRIVGIRGEEESAAGGADDANAAAATIKGVAGRRFVEMANGDDRHASALGEAFQRVKCAAHSLIIIRVVTACKKGNQGVDDQKRSLSARDD